MNTILVINTSSGADDSSVSADLAVKFTEEGKNVALIDCNLRHPTIHKLFNLENDLGLSNVLYEQLSPLTIMKTSQNNNLSIMTSGSHPVNIFKSFNTDKMRDHLAVLVDNYDRVIIQGPPFFSREALSLAALVDSVFLLIHPGFNRSETSHKIIEKFQLSGAHVAGIAMRSQSHHPFNQTSIIGNTLTFENPISQLS